MDILEAIQPYRDAQTGLIMAAGGGRDNLPVFTATLLQLMTPEQVKGESDRITSYLGGSMVEPGLYRRYPGGPMDNSIDNVVGIISMCDRIGFNHPIHDIFEHGSTHRWTYCAAFPNQKFSPFNRATYRYWFGRFPGIPCFIKMAAGEKVGLIERIGLNQAIVWNARMGGPTDVGNRILQWLINRTLFGRDSMIDNAIRAWRAQMKREYPGGMKQVLAYYHGSSSPLPEFAREDFA